MYADGVNGRYSCCDTEDRNDIDIALRRKIV